MLLEGPSDVAALTVLLGEEDDRPGPSSYELVDLGGVTNVGAHLERAHRLDPVPRVAGLCDAGEAGFVVRALQRVGRDVGGPADLPGENFFVCQRDLEDELIRALGPQRSLGILEELGLAGRFAAFSQQPAWAGRPLTERLHRFSGIASGRKILLAGAMAAGLEAERVPPPLAGLVGALAESEARA